MLWRSTKEKQSRVLSFSSELAKQIHLQHAAAQEYASKHSPYRITLHKKEHSKLSPKQQALMMYSCCSLSYYLLLVLLR
jgi:anaerobic ribonucleoside-triphosphate reductase